MSEPAYHFMGVPVYYTDAPKTRDGYTGIDYERGSMWGHSLDDVVYQFYAARELAGDNPMCILTAEGSPFDVEARAIPTVEDQTWMYDWGRKFIEDVDKALFAPSDGNLTLGPTVAKIEAASEDDIIAVADAGCKVRLKPAGLTGTLSFQTTFDLPDDDEPKVVTLPDDMQKYSRDEAVQRLAESASLKGYTIDESTVEGRKCPNRFGYEWRAVCRKVEPPTIAFAPEIWSRHLADEWAEWARNIAQEMNHQQQEESREMHAGAANMTIQPTVAKIETFDKALSPEEVKAEYDKGVAATGDDLFSFPLFRLEDGTAFVYRINVVSGEAKVHVVDVAHDDASVQAVCFRNPQTWAYRERLDDCPYGEHEEVTVRYRDGMFFYGFPMVPWLPCIDERTVKLTGVEYAAGAALAVDGNGQIVGVSENFTISGWGGQPAVTIDDTLLRDAIELHRRVDANGLYDDYRDHELRERMQKLEMGDPE